MDWELFQTSLAKSVSAFVLGTEGTLWIKETLSQISRALVVVGNCSFTARENAEQPSSREKGSYFMWEVVKESFMKAD